MRVAIVAKETKEEEEIPLSEQRTQPKARLSFLNLHFLLKQIFQDNTPIFLCVCAENIERCEGERYVETGESATNCER